MRAGVEVGVLLVIPAIMRVNAPAARDVRIDGVRVAVVGHVEWIEFARVEHVPLPGEIIRATESWEEPGGGGAVAALRLAALTGSCTFFTALGDDWRGRRSVDELTRLGVRVEAAFRPGPQRRGFVYLDASGERTITVIEEKMHPRVTEPLPWGELADYDAVYYCAGEPEAIRAARAARTLVATARELPSCVPQGSSSTHSSPARAMRARSTGRATSSRTPARRPHRGRRRRKRRARRASLPGSSVPRRRCRLLRGRRQLRRRSGVRPRRRPHGAGGARRRRARGRPGAHQSRGWGGAR